MARADLGGVFAQRHITGPMQPIFDVSMSVHPLQDLSHQGVGRQTAHEVAPFMARRPRGVAGPTHPGLDRQHQPDFQPEQVVEASLDGLRRGELVCCPSLHDDALLREFDHAKDAIFNHANTTGTLAVRYRRAASGVDASS